MKKITILVQIILLFLMPLTAFAQDGSDGSEDVQGEYFEAKVIKVLKEDEVTVDDGTQITAQTLKVVGLEERWEGEEIVIDGAENVTLNNNLYREGDKVLVNYFEGLNGEDNYFVVDYIRRGYLYFLALLFALVIVVVGRMKGLKSLISLIVSFFIIIKLIIPPILNGTSPLLIGLLGSFAILVVIIYMTEGFNRKSHLSIISVFFSLFITFLFALLFTYLTRLTGLSDEDAMFLVGINKTLVDFRGLLLAGILIGTVGVLDDVIIGQIEAVKQIREANPTLSNFKVFKLAFKIGNTHLGAIINTLFLTYAGASLPLLLLFSVGAGGSVNFSQVINTEIIATEIVRTLVGSIGLAFAVPIATFLGAWFLKDKNQKKISNIEEMLINE